MERFVRFIEALGESTLEIKSHATLIDTMSDSLEKISNADMDQVRRVREVVRFVREGPSETQVEGDVSAGTKKGVLSQMEEGVSAETTVEGEVSFEAKMKVMSTVKELESAEAQVEEEVSAGTKKGVLSQMEEGVSAETTVEGEVSFEAKMKVMSTVKELESAEAQVEEEVSAGTKKGVLSQVEEGMSAETTVRQVSFEAKMKVVSTVKEFESAETKIGEVSAETEAEGTYAKDNDTTSELSLTSLPPQRSVQYPGFVEPRFVSLFDRESLANGHSEWLVHDPAHGVRINIPADSVPPNVEKFTVKIHAYINGNFHIPDEYEICTAIVMIQTDPQFEFLKPVSLKLPHCAIFEGDEDEDDFVIFCAPDPVMYDDKNTSTPRTAPPICKFSESNILRNVDFSEDYYIQIDLDHFSAFVGANKRRQCRRPKIKSKLSLYLSRESSINKQKRSRRSAMKKRIKKADSMGSSRQSSYEGSFDKEVVLKRQQSPLLRQYSSAESDGPLHKQLQRQVAITDDVASKPLQHQSSSIDDLSSIQILVCCCHPVRCITNWKTCFMVVPNLPTGKRVGKNFI